MDPKAFLSLASQLLIENDEAKYRTSTGRSYYSLFLALRKHLSSSPYNIKFSHNSVHLDVRSTAAIGKMNYVSGVLKDTHQKRINADYEIDNTFPFQDAEDTYTKANKILSAPLAKFNLFVKPTLKCCRVIKIFQDKGRNINRFLFISPKANEIITCDSRDLQKELTQIKSINHQNLELTNQEIDLFDSNALKEESWLYSKKENGSYVYCYKCFIQGSPCEQSSYNTCNKLIDAYVNAFVK